MQNLHSRKEDSLESFKNFQVVTKEEIYEASDNNSKEELHLLNELLEFQKKTDENLLDDQELFLSNQDYSSYHQQPSNLNQKLTAFDHECNYFNDTLVLYSRNNGIENHMKKNYSAKNIMKQEMSISSEASKNEFNFTLQTKNQSLEYEKYQGNLYLHQRNDQQIQEVFEEKVSRNFENAPFLLRQPSNKIVSVVIPESETSNSSRNLFTDPNEISFNKDQFQFLFNKENFASSKIPMQREDKIDICLLEQKRDADSIQNIPVAKNSEENSIIHDSETSNNLSTKESLNNNIEKKLYLSEKMIFQTSSYLMKLQEENVQLRQELNFFKSENESLRSDFDKLEKSFKNFEELHMKDVTTINNLQQNMSLVMMILHQREEDIEILKKNYDQLSTTVSLFSEKPPTVKSMQRLSEASNYPPNEVNFAYDYENQHQSISMRANNANSYSKKSPLRENIGIMNQQDEYTHTEDSFGEYNHNFRVHSHEDEEFFIASNNSKNAQNKKKDIRKSSSSPSNSKENIPEYRNRSTESPKPNDYKTSKSNKNENSVKNNNFENILNGLILLKNSIDSAEGPSNTKEKNFKKYNDYFKKQKELVEKSEKLRLFQDEIKHKILKKR